MYWFRRYQDARCVTLKVVGSLQALLFCPQLTLKTIMVLAIVRHPSLVRSTCQASLVDHSLLRLFLIDPIISIHYVVAMESCWFAPLHWLCCIVSWALTLAVSHVDPRIPTQLILSDLTNFWSLCPLTEAHWIWMTHLAEPQNKSHDQHVFLYAFVPRKIEGSGIL